MDLIVCAFPGTGKSTAYADHTFLPDYERMSRTELDQIPTQSKILYYSDSSNFPKDHFPENYLEHIQACRGRGTDVVQLVSTQDTVTAGLAALNILHIIVYPRAEDKELYLARYRERGSPEPFITLMDQKWDDFMASVRKAAEHPLAHGIELQPDQYVADVVAWYIADIDAALKLLNRNWRGRYEPNLGALQSDKPKVPDYPLGKAYPYSHKAYRTILVELVTKFRLTDKKIQRGTGINRVRLNKMYTSTNSYIAKGEWEALLAFAKTLGCYPFGPKRSTPVVTSPAAITTIPTSDMVPETMVENLGQFFDKRDVQMATSEKHFEGDTFNTLPNGVALEKPPELRTDPSDSSDRTVTFSGEVRTNEQTAPSAAEIAETLGLTPPQATDDTTRR